MLIAQETSAKNSKGWYVWDTKEWNDMLTGGWVERKWFNDRWIITNKRTWWHAVYWFTTKEKLKELWITKFI